MEKNKQEHLKERQKEQRSNRKIKLTTKTIEEHPPARNPNNFMLSNEQNDETAQRWCLNLTGENIPKPGMKYIIC